MLKGPPAGLRGKSDIVHIRLLYLFLGNKGSSAVVNNTAMLLEPGGYVQWEEVDMSQSIIATTNDSFMPVAIARMDQIMRARAQRSLIPKIERLLWENSFQVGKCYHVAPRMGLLKCHMDMHVLAFVEAALTMPEGSEQRKETLELVAEVEEEAKQGAGHGAAKVTFVAQWKV